jgi:hypothetical protein
MQPREVDDGAQAVERLRAVTRVLCEPDDLDAATVHQRPRFRYQQHQPSVVTESSERRVDRRPRPGPVRSEQHPDDGVGGPAPSERFDLADVDDGPAVQVRDRHPGCGSLGGERSRPRRGHLAAEHERIRSPGAVRIALLQPTTAVGDGGHGGGERGGRRADEHFASGVGHLQDVGRRQRGRRRRRG